MDPENRYARNLVERIRERLPPSSRDKAASSKQ